MRAPSTPLLAMNQDAHEMVVYGADVKTGLKTIIAIHSTRLGPALGGARFYPYEDEADALADALRLAHGMTLKSAAAGLNLGGGKSVILGDPRSAASADLLHAYGRVVDALGGRYIAAEDVGTSVDDMVSIRSTTPWVAGLPKDAGGSGDPSLLTARGVVTAMQAVNQHVSGTDALEGSTVAVQGAGKVGSVLISLLAEMGARVYVSDLDPMRADRVASATNAQIVAVNEILSIDCDFFAPCAMGACSTGRQWANSDAQL